MNTLDNFARETGYKLLSSGFLVGVGFFLAGCVFYGMAVPANPAAEPGGIASFWLAAAVIGIGFWSALGSLAVAIRRFHLRTSQAQHDAKRLPTHTVAARRGAADLDGLASAH